MTREEEIITACKGFLAAYPNIDQAGLSIGFLDGAKWADAHPINVWHDASDNPTKDTLILYRTTSGECGITELACTSEGVWHLFVKEYEVAEWAYIEDLLPKGGEK